MREQIQHGDRVSIDNDHWDMIGRNFEVLAVKYRENSTAVELVLEDVVDGDIFKCVVADNQIIKDTHARLD